MSQIKQVVELPYEQFQEIQETSKLILTALQNLNLTPAPDFLTAQEWMDACKVSRWKFDSLRNDGKLRVKQIGRKYYIPRTEVQRFFNGELTLT
ncbi:MAG: helix-turn-helix domain-containing protein [Cytophagales bacterium]|jgi:hypothetical protein|nr:helix-turn-helix domain-containing protein [Cytophagales bacterium]MCA6387518.1 helix-turn-helix domain-containing protein [Cytophagales bacterium]MCA6391189.1 helix-turn-helix domain-containing protein [Cytophagales bacterium]MCA6395827.1 helix-turn-helix domain-containing protein [Cytophagales bacterium]MCA6397666.1 helix-turn-helix domain-containing protein [Cytophagales bacterium]